MILQLDIGNTRVKWRLWERGRASSGGALSRARGELLPALDHAPEEIWVASVAGGELEARMSSLAQSRWGIEPWFARTGRGALGLVNSYADPERMGVDRWLAMLAAWVEVRGAVCAIDAGSALTIDFVGGTGRHLGGYILPGLDSMERALLDDTDRVRFSDAPRDSLAPGRSTEEAVRGGLLLSQAGAARLALERQEGDFSLFFSGGNGELLRRASELGGRYVPDLVLDGLAALARDGRGR